MRFKVVVAVVKFFEGLCLMSEATPLHHSIVDFYIKPQVVVISTQEWNS
jgi:hypothetical protein